MPKITIISNCFFPPISPVVALQAFRFTCTKSCILIPQRLFFLPLVQMQCTLVIWRRKAWMKNTIRHGYGKIKNGNASQIGFIKMLSDRKSDFLFMYHLFKYGMGFSNSNPLVVSRCFSWLSLGFFCNKLMSGYHQVKLSNWK